MLLLFSCLFRLFFGVSFDHFHKVALALSFMRASLLFVCLFVCLVGWLVGCLLRSFDPRSFDFLLSGVDRFQEKPPPKITGWVRRGVRISCDSCVFFRCLKFFFGINTLIL